MGPGFREVPLYRGGEVVAYAKVDPEDYWEVTEHRWRLHPQGYAIQSRRDGTLMHRFLMELPSQAGHAHKGLSPEIDHINHDRLDNRRANLRIVDRATNQENKLPTGKSGVLNVKWDKRRSRWAAVVRRAGKQVEIGFFESIDLAEEALSNYHEGKRNPAEISILDRLAAGPGSSATIAAELGSSTRTVAQRLRQLQRDGLVESFRTPPERTWGPVSWRLSQGERKRAKEAP